MSDTSQGEGWWLASDGRWYPPESFRPPPPAPPVANTWTAPQVAYSPAPPAPVGAFDRSLPPGVTLSSPWERLGSYVVDYVLVLVTLGIGWLIWAATIAGDGVTPGKKLLNLRVISTSDLRPVGIGTM